MNPVELVEKKIENLSFASVDEPKIVSCTIFKEPEVAMCPIFNECTEICMEATKTEISVEDMKKIEVYFERFDTDKSGTISEEGNQLLLSKFSL